MTYQVTFEPANRNTIVNSHFLEMLSEEDIEGENEYFLGIIRSHSTAYNLESEVSLTASSFHSILPIESCTFDNSKKAFKINLEYYITTKEGDILTLIKRTKNPLDDTVIYDILVATRYRGATIRNNSVYLGLNID